MLVVFFSVILIIGLILTGVLAIIPIHIALVPIQIALIPIHLVTFGHVPSWAFWGIFVVGLSWLIGD